MGLLPVLYLSASLFPTPHPHRPEAQTPPHLFSSSVCNDTVTCTTHYAHVSHQNGTPHPPEKAGTFLLYLPLACFQFSVNYIENQGKDHDFKSDC